MNNFKLYYVNIIINYINEKYFLFYFEFWKENAVF